MAGPPVEVQMRVNVGVVAFSSELSWNCTEDTTIFPVEKIIVEHWNTNYTLYVSSWCNHTERVDYSHIQNQLLILWMKIANIKILCSFVICPELFH